jgi:hypothetical protein
MPSVRWIAPWLLLLGCTSPAPEPPSFPAPDAFAVAGPGAPSLEYSDAELNEHCAYLDGGPTDEDHHNLAIVHDGWLWNPWSPEWGGGGMTAFDMTDPCAPVKVGEAEAPLMRESHSLAFGRVDGRDYVAVDYHEDVGEDEDPLGGVGFWDITDPTDPQWVSELALPGYLYPDSYLRLTLHTFWQGDYVYVAGAFNGVYVVDASDPLNPQLAAQHVFEGNMLVGSFHVVGDRAMAGFAGGTRTILADLSDPRVPVPLPNGDFNLRDGEGDEISYYFPNLSGRYALFARKHNGGGPVVYDLDVPGLPRFVADHFTEGGAGGYVFGQNGQLFQGDGDFGAVFDWEGTTITERTRFELRGDLDTVTPFGNIAIVAVDEGATEDQATAVVPWAATPDVVPPSVGWHRPADGDRNVATSVRIGLSLDETLEPRSAHAGSVRVWDEDLEPVAVQFNVQEGVVNASPVEPLQPDTTYFVQVPAGGLRDVSGNAIEQPVRFRFSTGGDLADWWDDE